MAATALRCELHDGKKATSEHLSSAEGKFNWIETSELDHTAGLGKMAVNDPAERSFGAMTGQLQCFSRVGLTNAGGVSQVRVNGDFSRGFGGNVRDSKKTRTEGVFHTLSEEMRRSLLTVAMEDASAARVDDNVALAQQRAAK